MLCQKSLSNTFVLKKIMCTKISWGFHLFKDLYSLSKSTSTKERKTGFNGLYVNNIGNTFCRKVEKQMIWNATNSSDILTIRGLVPLQRFYGWPQLLEFRIFLLCRHRELSQAAVHRRQTLFKRAYHLRLWRHKYLIIKRIAPFLIVGSTMTRTSYNKQSLKKR